MADDQTDRSATQRAGRSLRAVQGAAGRAGGLARDAAARVDQAARSTRTARVVADLEDRMWALRRERKIGKGTLRATYVVAYRGFVAQGVANVLVRVMEEPVIPAAESLPKSALLRANVRRFFALAFPGVRVRVTIGGATGEALTDRHGYATVQLPAAELPPGWADFECVTMPVDEEETPARASGRVLVPDPRSRIAIVSDVDDTVLRTGLAEGLTAIRNTLLNTPGTRRAIPGMAALYRCLHAARVDSGKPAFYYVSTGPWTLYDVLTEFMAIRGFPDGVLFLTDWAPQERYVVRSGPEHKASTLQRLLEAFPDTQFVLVGDSGQKDPDTYLAAAREHPDQVRAVIIRDVGPSMADRAAALIDDANRWRAEGVPFHFVRDAVGAADILRELGLLASEDVSTVRAAMYVEADE